MSKFGKYFLIVLLSLVGLCAIGILYLFFVPNSNLFGICYISYNKNIDSQTYNVDENLINTIVLNSRNYELEVVPASSGNNNIYLRVYSNSFGFVLKKNSQPSVEASLLTGVLTFNVSEPFGACAKGRSKITLYIPEDYVTDLKLYNKNAISTINGKKLKIDNLLCSTNNGEFNFKNCTISGNISVKLNRGNFSFDESVVTDTNMVELNTFTGNFYASNSVLGNVDIKSNFRAMVKIKSCTKFTLSNTSAGGSVEIGEVGELIVNSSDTNLKIGKVTASASVVLTSSGKVDIDEINKQSSIKTNNGDINIKKATASLLLQALGNGNVKLNNTTAALITETKYGNISINFDQTAESYADNTNSRMLQATTKDGRVYANGVENVTIKITGSGSAEVYMKKVIGNSEIITDSGSVYVQFDDDASFVLNTIASNNIANVNYLALVDVGGNNHQYPGDKTFEINTIGANDNKLKIDSLTGSIKVRDYSTRDTK